MQFSLRYGEEIWELTDHEKEVMVLVIHWEITAKFRMVPIDSNGFWSSFNPKNRHVGDISRTRGWSVYISPKMCLVWPECIHVHVPVCTFNYILQCKFKTCPFVYNIQQMFPSLGRTMRSPVAGKSSVNEWIFTMDEFIRENTNLTTNLRFYSLPVYHCSVLNFACTKRSLSL